VIQKYIRKNYGSILEIAKVITRGNKNEYEDLAHEIMVLLLTGNREKMNALVKRGEIKWYILRITINEYRGKKGVYYKKYRRHQRMLYDKSKIKEHHAFLNSLDEIQNKYNDEKVFEFLDHKIDEMPWFEKNCFAIYYYEGLSLNSMSELTGINRNTLYRAIRKVRNFLQDEIKKESWFRR
jgi:RNA polymerase sigma factor (sigma-70 family)